MAALSASRVALAISDPTRQILLARQIPLGFAAGKARLVRQSPTEATAAAARTSILARRFSTNHPARAIPVTTASTHGAEADAQQLRALFDAPESSSSPASERTARAGLASTSGLFASPSLRSPDSFVDLAQRTLLRAQLLVSRIVAAPRNGQREMERVVRNLDRLSDLLCGVIDCAELVRNAHPDPLWVEAANTAYETLCGYMNILNTHTGLYEVLAQVLNDPALRQAMPSEALAVAYVFLRDFEKSGIHLPQAQREQFVNLSDEILVLGRAFLQNGAETSSLGQNTSTENERIPFDWLQSAPPAVMEALKSSYPTKSGALLIPKASWGMQVISKYVPDDRARHMAYRSMNSGSAEQVMILNRLLERRAELADLTGSENFAAMTLTDKMARKPENVDGFLSALAKRHQPLAEHKIDELRSIKQQQQGTRDFFAWDREYYSEKYLRALNLKSSAPPIGSFFSVGTVFAGLSRMLERLFGISLRAALVSPGEVWADDVCKIEVVEDGQVIGTIYADLYSRKGKPPSAAHYTVRCSRRTDDDDELGDFLYGHLDNGDQISVEQGADLAKPLEVDSVPGRGRPGQYQLPIVVLLCDFVRPTINNGPSLMSWTEVETLFHEMGHAIHSMIGRTEYHNVSGTRCATDFVELPSILMEHFVSSPDVVALVARHHTTDAPLPFHHLESHLKTTRSLDPLDTHHQLTLATLDQEYHSARANRAKIDSTAALNRVQGRLGIMRGSEDVSWQVHFSHLFGYGATYYSYLFDRVIAARVWQRLFQGAPLDRRAGEVYKTGILAHGGGRDPWNMLADVLQDEELQEGSSSARAMQAVGRWGIAESGNA